MPVAQTKARTAKSITLYVLPDINADIANMSLAELTAQFKNGVKIGGAQSISISDDISLGRVRELDASEEGETLEIVPGVEDITLTLRRVEFYDSTIAEALGYSTEELIRHRTPFAIQIEKSAPDGTTKYEYFLGCRLKSNPVGYDITADPPVYQEVTIWAAKRR